MTAHRTSTPTGRQAFNLEQAEPIIPAEIHKSGSYVYDFINTATHHNGELMH